MHCIKIKYWLIERGQSVSRSWFQCRNIVECRPVLFSNKHSVEKPQCMKALKGFVRRRGSEKRGDFILFFCTLLYFTVVYYILLCYTVFYSIILHSTILYCMLLYFCILLYFTVFFCILLYYIVVSCTLLYCIIGYYTLFYYILLYSTVLYCMVLYSTVFSYFYCILLRGSRWDTWGGFHISAMPEGEK